MALVAMVVTITLKTTVMAVVAVAVVTTVVDVTLFHVAAMLSMIPAVLASSIVTSLAVAPGKCQTTGAQQSEREKQAGDE
ncbi:MAG: hypothetical protein ABI178_15250 [Rhodanobacter sp.]